MKKLLLALIGFSVGGINAAISIDHRYLHDETTHTVEGRKMVNMNQQQKNIVNDASAKLKILKGELDSIMKSGMSAEEKQAEIQNKIDAQGEETIETAKRKLEETLKNQKLPSKKAEESADYLHAFNKRVKTKEHIQEIDKMDLEFAKYVRKAIEHLQKPLEASARG